MKKEELFNHAQTDVQYAIMLGNSVINGLITIVPEELMELYYILRQWQDKLGKNVPTAITQIVAHIEYIGEDATPILKEYYEKRVQFENRLLNELLDEPVETEPVQDKQASQSGIPYPFFIPINNGGIVS